MSELLQTFPPSPSTTRGFPCVITTHPKEKKICYVSQRNVVVRSLDNPLDVLIYSEHTFPTTAARISPSGYYVASGDSSGKVRVWALTNDENILKYECQVLGGPIRDIAWTEDSKRIIAVGEGSDSFGRAFMWDSGSSCGEIKGHEKNILSVDIKQTRPYRAVTGSVDKVACFFNGVPFKFTHSIKEHERFVNCVRYSPNSERFVTVSSDKMGHIFDGKEGTKLLSLDASAGHKGGIYAVAWSPNSKQLLTASGDKTAKVWDAESGQCVNTFGFAENPQTEHQQLGCAWVQDQMLSVSLDSVIAFLDANSPALPTKRWYGHNTTCSAVAYHAATDTLLTGGASGRVLRWSRKTGDTVKIEGDGHTNALVRILLHGNHVVTVAKDDTVRYADISGDTCKYHKSVSTRGAPCDAGLGPDNLIVVATNKNVQVIKDGAEVAYLECKAQEEVHSPRGGSVDKAGFAPSAAAFSPCGKFVAVGSDETVGGHQKGHAFHTLRVYKFTGSSLELSKEIKKHNGPITSVAFSPDGAYLASSDKLNQIFVWDVKADFALKIGTWCFHTASVTRVNWAPNSKHLVSSGIDSQAIVWNVDKETAKVQLKKAHPLGVMDVCFVSDDTIATTGMDASIRVWKIQLP